MSSDEEMPFGADATYTPPPKTETISSPKSPQWSLVFGYFAIWFLTIYISHLIYKKYFSSKLARDKGEGDAWFGVHKEREAYEALVRDGNATEDALRKALLRRAMTDLRRAWQLASEKETIQKLVHEGSIGEGMLEEFQLAEKETQVELMNLQAEAETFRLGWGNEIIKEAAALVRREDELVAMRDSIQSSASADEPTSKARSNATVSKSLRS